ncbi:phospholipase D family protein [Planococcus lenghuensis]|uniref:phospholipase D n=1 Tax=Planococcus lenghuensis TaxID=2213202 RepID=A0A1Q2L1P3_9BACL|nr:phospholipase D family protein [Planococcus lenghuensis]AQQ54359.1 phospholipase [Planococcus lenghuensis]
MSRKPARKMNGKKKGLLVGIALFAVLYLAVIAWHTFKPLPAGLSYAGELREAETVEMIADLSFAQDEKGTDLQHELRIFEEVYGVIDRAEEFIVLDFFLFDHYGMEGKEYPAIAETLTARLVDKKEQKPDMPIYFITDPLNTGYGSYDSPHLAELEQAGIEVIYTDLDKLRDSFPLYSGLYRLFFQWPYNPGEWGVSNPMAKDAPDMTLPSYLTMLNIKANHRKAVITESEAIVSSANPHNASGFHGNMAFKVSGPVLNDMLEAEEAVSLFSGGPELPRTDSKAQEGPYRVQYLTEQQTLKSLLGDIETAEKGNEIWLGMYFLAKRDIIGALEGAADRGADVRIILDPNKNAFGREKSGLPNRPVVHEIMEDSSDNLQVRWYNTVVGQYHTKTIMIRTDDRTVISGGSSNYTERTLDDYNVESNLRIEAPNDSELVRSMEAYFTRLWNNEDALYTLEAEAYQSDLTFLQRGVYGVQKLLKFTTY